MNSRMVQGIFDDLNPETRSLWVYPDTKRWDPERNTREFLAAMPEWRRHGLLSFTINIQGGSPQGYSPDQPWHNIGVQSRRIAAPRLPAASRAHPRSGRRAGHGRRSSATSISARISGSRMTPPCGARCARRRRGCCDKGYRNMLVEIANECNNRNDHAAPDPGAARARADRAGQATRRGRRTVPVSVSFNGGSDPPAERRRASPTTCCSTATASPTPIASPHGSSDARRRRATGRCRSCSTRTTISTSTSRGTTSSPRSSEYASWGYFDFRMKGEGFDEGYQSVPVNWGISSARKRAFFTLLKEMTGR